ncbi:PRC-barrel domain-containing protein [Afifella sp. IM 167]|uniref:PRC-barrel domain-containing protein n=1 Tax=Afifella sp. IM 167 TaxID=2033586 RepID=UPI001CCFCFB7|nr:PRC-barrel domain-containing protein [Afifella sp. IM 167]
MSTKSISLALAVALLAASPALAQQAWVEIDDDDAPVNVRVDPPTYTVEDLKDMEIVGADGEEIGEVDDVLVSSDGSSMAVAAEVGGFLGMGEHEVVLPLEGAHITNDKLVITMTADQIKQLDEWQKK